MHAFHDKRDRYASYLDELIILTSPPGLTNKHYFKGASCETCKSVNVSIIVVRASFKLVIVSLKLRRIQINGIRIIPCVAAYNSGSVCAEQ